MTADYIDPDDIERMIVRHETESRILGAYTDLDYSVSIRLHDATAVMLRSLAAENARRQLESTAYDRALSAGPLHTSVVPISTAPDCHRDEMP